MEINNYILTGYGLFLFIILIINLLYIFQIFRYRLPGDASIIILATHLLIIGVVLLLTTSYLSIN